tara:strand:- start:857 stop:2332 length:1476 start_codon:yes stop_codon:yes gene_type:complete
MPINQLTDDGFGFLAGSSGATPSFAPSDIAGLKLWLDADAANVNTEAAAFFPSTARQDLSSTSTEFDFNGSSFSVCGWVNRPAGGTLAYHFTKSTGTTNQRAINISTNASGFVRMFISNNGTGFTSTVTSTTALVNLNTWYFISCVFDFDNSTSKITVNGGTDFEDTASETNVFSSNAPVFFNAINEGAGFKSQKLDLFCVYSKALSIGEINAIYNSGNATAYADLSAAQKTGLVSWWSLSETNGTRYDQHGTNNLTDFGNVTWAAGVLDEPVVNNSPVSLWIDKSTATNNATQATAIAQPTWNISGGSNGTSFIDFDGSTDYLSSVNFSPDVLSAGNQTFTFLSVFKLNSLPAANQIILSLSQTGNAYNRFELRLSSTGELRILIRESLADGGNFVQTDVSTADTNWHYVLWTFDNDTLNCWLDGVKVITNTSQGLDEILPQSFTLGALDAGSISFNADCSISECISYNNVVTAGQISDLDSYINGIYSL